MTDDPIPHLSSEVPLDADIDPDLQATAGRVRDALHEGSMREAFRADLRARLVAAHAEQVATRAEQVAAAPPATAVEPVVVPLADARSARRRRAARLGWVATAAAAAVVGAVAVQRGLLPGTTPVAVVALSESLGATVDPSGQVSVRFSQPLDHAATVSALKLSPAAALRPSWQGDTLTLTPQHGFAPNTGYVLTVDRSRARTASGAPLAEDVHVVFGTAPGLVVGPPPGPPASLPLATVATTADDSEAVVLRDGSLLMTAAKASAGSGYRQGLVRVTASGASSLGAATDAICVSRSGQSVAYLAPTGHVQQVVMADGYGSVTRAVTVSVDQGSPLGWIGDSEVSFVSGGRLRAVDRAGSVRVLSDTPVDVAHDDVVLAPGGRFVYLAPAKAPGRLVDLTTGAAHPLDGLTAGPAFSADGATVVWVRGTGSSARLASAPSAGGPTTAATLPVADGDAVSDLAVSPDGSHLLYSVVPRSGRPEIRLASLPDGDTLAVSQGSTGESPNWDPSGRRFTVLTHAHGSQQISVAALPASVVDRQASSEATAQTFANAQLSGDRAAQASLVDSSVTLPAATPSDATPSRATVVWVLPTTDGAATARIRLTVDPTPARPRGRQLDETVRLAFPDGQARPRITAVEAGTWAEAPAGPAVTHVDTDAVPGSVLVTFDSDVDPASLSHLTLTTATGQVLPSSASYDSALRTVTLRPKDPGARGRAVLLTVGTGVTDVAGRPAPALEVRVGELPPH